MPLNQQPIGPDVVRGVGGKSGVFDSGGDTFSAVALGYVLPGYIEGQDAYVFLNDL